VIGLRYEGCAATLAIHGLNSPEVWEGLRIIERQFVTELDRRREEEKPRR
jgi:hypothetical protein